jgi:hypothetical protein
MKAEIGKMEVRDLAILLGKRQLAGATEGGNLD